jgi:hypothetical protein
MQYIFVYHDLHWFIDLFVEYGVSFDDLTNIEKGPIFQEQPKSLVVVSHTPTAHLECRASCNPQCDYKWYKGLTLSEEVSCQPTELGV